MSYYEILGVSKDASYNVIKRKYKELAQKHHPDRGGNIDHFIAIKEAYDVLSDSESRKHYDEKGTKKPSIDISKMRQIVAQLLFNAIDNCYDLDRIDLLETVRSKVIVGRTEMERQIVQLDKRIEKRNKAISKISNTKEKENILVMMLEADNKNTQMQKETITSQIKEAEEVLQFLEDYKYEFESAKNIPSTNGSYTTFKPYTSL